jgi:hypothetical protein
VAAAAEVAAGAAAAEVAADAAASVVAAAVLVAAVVAAAAGSVASGLVAAWAAWAAWVVRAARLAGVAGVAPDRGERAANSHEKRRCDGRRITSGLPNNQTTRCRPPLRKSAQKQPSDGQYLPLALDDALKRMPMFAGKRDHLRRLCL